MGQPVDFVTSASNEMKVLVSFALVATFVASPVIAQQTIPPAAPTIGASAGAAGGIAIPIGEWSDNHGAGYTLGGLVDFSAADQPYSFRAELMWQRYDRKRSAPTGVGNKNVLGLAVNVLARTPTGASSGYVIGGIGVYRVTDEGTRPGLNAGAGLEVPLTFFIGIADVRIHWVLSEGRPGLSIPITLGARF
jgi:hypothetical protein